MKKILIASVLVLAFVFPTEIFGDGIEKRLVFTKARTTFTLRGKLQRYLGDYDAYVFRARKGQTITVKLTTDERDASFTIYELKKLGPEEDLIFPQNEMIRRYTGELPITSEYGVQVYGKTSPTEGPTSGAPYTIEISLR